MIAVQREQEALSRIFLIQKPRLDTIQKKQPHYTLRIQGVDQAFKFKAQIQSELIMAKAYTKQIQNPKFQNSVDLNT